MKSLSVFLRSNSIDIVFFLSNFFIDPIFFTFMSYLITSLFLLYLFIIFLRTSFLHFPILIVRIVAEFSFHINESYCTIFHCNSKWYQTHYESMSRCKSRILNDSLDKSIFLVFYSSFLIGLIAKMKFYLSHAL